MRAVAREAGTSLGPAYHRYASKEEFALALYLHVSSGEHRERETIKIQREFLE